MVLSPSILLLWHIDLIDSAFMCLHKGVDKLLGSYLTFRNIHLPSLQPETTTYPNLVHLPKRRANKGSDVCVARFAKVNVPRENLQVLQKAEK